MKTTLRLLAIIPIFFIGSCNPPTDAPASDAPPSKPNVLILYADDLGYGDLGCYNPKSKIPTPHLDKLADEGVRFTDGHSSSGICTPSRYALLTGRYHWRDFHGIVGVFEESVFKPEQLTLPEMLKEKGYTTAAIGKWHLGWDWTSILKPDAEPNPYGNPERGRFTYGPDDMNWDQPIADGPLAHGFDYYFGDTVINFPPYAWIENDRVTQAPDTMMDTRTFPAIKEGHWECRPGPMVSGWNPYENIPTTTSIGVEKIRKFAEAGQPFFLYFAFPSPHAPIIPNNEFDGSSEAGPYGDFVVETDTACGKLLRALEDAGVANNTIVIFSADNGPEKYAYPRDEQYDHWSSEPLRGLKQDIYEGGHRVPFIIKWPGLTEPGSVSHALVSQIDMMATLAAIVDYELPDNQAEDSYNMLPVLHGDAKGSRTTHVHNTFAENFALRHENWLLIDTKTGYARTPPEPWVEKHNYPPDNESPVELYDLSRDLNQHHNLAAEHPETVARLQKLLNTIREQGYSAPRLEP